jgi:hypothetical protein
MPTRFVIADTFRKSLARLDGQGMAAAKQAAFDLIVGGPRRGG